MHYILSFLVSIMAAVVSYYTRKWLDRNNTENPVRTAMPETLLCYTTSFPSKIFLICEYS
jgi:hypothetical protein